MTGREFGFCVAAQKGRRRPASTAVSAEGIGGARNDGRPQRGRGRSLRTKTVLD
jgi:hypothetical protein